MISIVIPVYQSEETLPNLYERLINIFKKINTEYEIILVDDHSEDRSWNIIKELSNKDFKVKGIRMIKNFGEHNALLCGIRLAKGDCKTERGEKEVAIKRLSKKFNSDELISH